jgi:hypothetical protein
MKPTELTAALSNLSDNKPDVCADPIEAFKETKSPKMVAMVESLTKTMFGRSRVDSINSGKCVTCGDPATTFKDSISRREFAISGMCQVCQDGVFNGDDS